MSEQSFIKEVGVKQVSDITPASDDRPRVIAETYRDPSVERTMSPESMGGKGFRPAPMDGESEMMVNEHEKFVQLGQVEAYPRFQSTDQLGNAMPANTNAYGRSKSDMPI